MSRFAIRRPGVYVEEIRSQPQPIEGVSTSTAAFLGETQIGPDTPTLVTGWVQFQSVFGGYFGPEKYLPYAVEGFFLNGGKRCYICRVTNGDYPSALAKLEAVEEVSIVYTPNAQAVPCLSDLLVAHAERLKRFVIFDSIKGQGPSDVTKPKASANAALYYPWIYIADSGIKRVVPSGGHIAGIYASTDLERGVHKAPANQPVKGAVDLEVTLTDSQQDSLNPKGVNCIRNFSSRGILVWGARTLSVDPEYKYINVRRLLIYLEQSIKQGTAWVAFEANDEATWARVRMQVDNFLMQAWRNGILMGAEQREAYFVKCDRTTMGQDDIDSGHLHLLVGVAAVKPAEFLVLHINQTVCPKHHGIEANTLKSTRYSNAIRDKRCHTPSKLTD